MTVARRSAAASFGITITDGQAGHIVCTAGVRFWKEAALCRVEKLTRPVVMWKCSR